MRPKLSWRSVKPTAPRASSRLKMCESLRMWSYAGTGSRRSSSRSVSCTAAAHVAHLTMGFLMLHTVRKLFRGWPEDGEGVGDVGAVCVIT